MELVESLIGREVTVGQGSECHLTFVRGLLHIAQQDPRIDHKTSLGGKLLIFFRRPSIRRTGAISGGLNMGQSAPSRFSMCWSCDLICIPEIRSDASHCKHVE